MPPGVQDVLPAEEGWKFVIFRFARRGVVLAAESEGNEIGYDEDGENGDYYYCNLLPRNVSKHTSPIGLEVERRGRKAGRGSTTYNDEARFIILLPLFQGAIPRVENRYPHCCARGSSSQMHLLSLAFDCLRTNGYGISPKERSGAQTPAKSELCLRAGNPDPPTWSYVHARARLPSAEISCVD